MITCQKCGAFISHDNSNTSQVCPTCQGRVAGCFRHDMGSGGTTTVTIPPPCSSCATLAADRDRLREALVATERTADRNGELHKRWEVLKRRVQDEWPQSAEPADVLAMMRHLEDAT